MPSYSSHQFYKDWRYALQKDFTDPSGEPVTYANNGHRIWGSEHSLIPFPDSPAGASINSDKTLLAIAWKEDIRIYETLHFTEVLVLKGHTAPVNAFEFHPKNPKLLVSAASSFQDPSQEPTILFWDLDEEKRNPMLDERTILKIASKAAETAMKNLSGADPGLELTPEDEKNLGTAIEPAITKIVKTRGGTKKKSLIGRMQVGFQSEIFSPSGKYLIYMPGSRPRSNDKDTWDIKIFDMEKHEDVFTLKGHSDSIMWTGFSPDEKLIATISWDQSMRIWDAEDGNEKFVFKTGGQNWTGGFSPDSRKFAGTCGQGTFYVCSMEDGSTLVEASPESGKGWMRCLSWSSNDLLAIGGGHGGGPGLLFLYDVEKKEVVQERKLSTDACDVVPEVKRMMGTYLDTNMARFVDGGKKLVTLTSGDGGFETYDLETWKKWRFARPGVDSESRQIKAVEGGSEDDKKEEEIPHGGYMATVWEDKERNTVWIASMDSDGVRIWDVPMSVVKED